MTIQNTSAYQKKKVRMEKDFELFMSQLQKTNRTLDFYTNFGNIERKVDSVRLSLHMLNSLIGISNLKEGVELIWERDKSAFNVLSILIAIRESRKERVIDNNDNVLFLNEFFSSPEKVIEYLETTGLADLFRQSKVLNLVDYVFGVEVGLDSNTRKNRSGKVMENQIDSIFTKNGLAFSKEVLSNKWDGLQKELGTDKKRFDYMIQTPRKTYLIEVNFYSGGGSKLNEVARAYSDLAPKINRLNDFEFVWITDGIGWQSARNKLQEAYYTIPHVYNLTCIQTFCDQVRQELEEDDTQLL